MRLVGNNSTPSTLQLTFEKKIRAEIDEKLLARDNRECLVVIKTIATSGVGHGEESKIKLLILDSNFLLQKVSTWTIILIIENLKIIKNSS